MALNPDEIVIGGSHRIHVAPAGTVMPTSTTALLDGAFIDLGYTLEAGVKFIDSKTVGRVQPSQSFYSVRNYVQSRVASIEFSLLQWNAESAILAFGGGTITSPVAGQFRYHPPAPETLGESAMVVDVTDGNRHFRISAPHGFVVSNTESTFARTGPGLLPVTFEILAPVEGADPWTFDTDDPIFDIIGS